MNNQFLNQKTPYEFAKSLADKIKHHRKKLKISQEVLAQKSGVSLGSIKRFETKYEISLQSLIKIAIALDTTSDYLMEGIPVHVTEELDYAKRLIARNVTQMSNSEKREIINILMGEGDE